MKKIKKKEIYTFLMSVLIRDKISPNLTLIFSVPMMLIFKNFANVDIKLKGF